MEDDDTTPESEVPLEQLSAPEPPLAAPSLDEAIDELASQGGDGGSGPGKIAAGEGTGGKQPSIPSPIQLQEITRSRLAGGIALGVGILLGIIVVMDGVDRGRTHELMIEALSRETEGTLQDILVLRKDQTQASNALMTVLITASFSALGTALGFYFGSNSGNDRSH